MKKTYLLAGIALLLAISCSRSENAPADQVAEPAHAEMDKADERSFNEEPPPAELGEEQPLQPAYTSTGGALTVEASSTSSGKPEVGRAISSSAAIQDPNDTLHRFVRSAELRFRVKNVVQATLGIEDIVGAHKGWVTETALKSNELGKDHIKVSEDSTLEIARYQITNEVTLRVPNTELDSTLRHIGHWVDLFEKRTIHADDVRLRMLANAMSKRRAQSHATRVARAINEKGSKLKETTAAEDAIMRDEEQADQTVLSNLDLKDRIDYSTVTLYFYERTQIRRELIANEKNVEGFRQPWGSRMSSAFRDGWRFLESVVVGAMTIWPLIVIVTVVLVIYFRRSRKPAKG